ncbi:MAG: gliding motility lipoprotein GldD [Paludibacteraceae bacterium]|nr:gliding motility lipoprotein GldD [Paludibacteraceae bacterium]
MNKTLYIALLPLSFILYACASDCQPKPYAYFRIELPPVEYRQTDSLGPYTTEISVNSHSDKTDSHWSTPSDKWINLTYPQLNATIHLSYKHITPDQLQTVTEESRTLVYKHVIRADNIIESYYEDSINSVYGVMYELTGNAASPAQFYMTDSTHNFLRGAVYFNNLPNYDSIMPCATYIENDLVHIIETLRWNN